MFYFTNKIILITGAANTDNTLVNCDPERIFRVLIETRLEVKSSWPYRDGRAAERMVTLAVSIL